MELALYILGYLTVGFFAFVLANRIFDSTESIRSMEVSGDETKFLMLAMLLWPAALLFGSLLGIFHVLTHAAVWLSKVGIKPKE